MHKAQSARRNRFIHERIRSTARNRARQAREYVPCSAVPDPALRVFGACLNLAPTCRGSGLSCPCPCTSYRPSGRRVASSWFDRIDAYHLVSASGPFTPLSPDSHAAAAASREHGTFKSLLVPGAASIVARNVPTPLCARMFAATHQYRNTKGHKILTDSWRGISPGATG